MDNELRRMDMVEYGVLLFLFLLLTVAFMVLFVVDFDRIFPPTPSALQSTEMRQAVRLVAASGALEAPPLSE